MSLAQLKIHNLRNIQSMHLNLHEHVNFIYGLNGSGKTSLLEAIYLLGSGHSFRTREILPLISQGQDSLTVFARAFDEQTISIQKALNSPTQVRLNSSTCQSSSELAYFLPCQIFYQDIFQIIDAGPSVRRSVIDWGLFHTNREYLGHWKNYKRALKQRNLLLRQKAPMPQLSPWNSVMDELAIQLDMARKDYFLQLAPLFTETLANLTTFGVTIDYYKGWDRRESGKSLKDILEDSYHTDSARQFTQYGPHQADLSISNDELAAKQYLSRGQQKVLLFALKFAQAKLIPRACLYLCDDLTSEFDDEHISRILNEVKTLKGQFFITSTSEFHSRMSVFSDFYQFFLMNGKITA